MFDKLNYAVTDLYLSNQDVVDIVKSIKPSPSGSLEITKITCPDEITYRQSWINVTQLENLAQPILKNGYCQHLLRILTERVF